MQHAQTTIYVPHIRNLDEVRLLASSEPAYPQPMKRCRVRGRTPLSDLPWATRSYDRAWQSYIRGNVVSESSARLIQTFLTIMAGTGKLDNDEDGLNGGRLLRKDLGSPGQRLTVADVHQVMFAEKSKAPTEDSTGNSIAKRIQSAMKLVQRLVTRNNETLCGEC